MRAAFGTELARHRPLQIAALELLRRALGVFETGNRHRDKHVGRAAGDVLALAAVALCLHHRIAFRRVAQRAAIASTFELHRLSPISPVSSLTPRPDGGNGLRQSDDRLTLRPWLRNP